MIYTGPIDEFYHWDGKLEYRSLKWQEETLDIDNYRYSYDELSDVNIPYTRIIEHKHFDYKKSNKTIISKEYQSKGDLIPFVIKLIWTGMINTQNAPK